MNKNSRLIHRKRQTGFGRERKARTMCVVLSAAMALTACAGTPEETASAITDENQEQVLREILNAQVSPSHSSEKGKEETVYVLADAGGGVNQVIVSDWLKNSEGGQSLKDCTDLSDIENVKGYESFEKDENGNITWKAEGADIYYRGNSDKEIPVEVKISYQLDGEDITPKELAGKSGRVTIRMNYVNKETKTVKIGDRKQDIRVPFVMLSGMVLPQDTFSNIEVTNARLLSEGNNNVVVGVAFPGLADSIHMEDLKEKLEEKKGEEVGRELEIPDFIEITADAENFELGMTMTVAMSDVLSDINLTDSFDLTELNDSMDELQEASNELKDGTVELKDGSGQLKDGTGELLTGANELWNGTVELKNGTQELSDKSALLDEGARALDDGAATLLDGTGALQDGVSELARGAGALQDGGQKLADGTGSLVSGAKELDAGAGTLASGLSKASQGARTIQSGMQQALEGSAKLATAAKGLKAQLEAQLAAGGGQTTAATEAVIGEQIARAEENKGQVQADMQQAQAAWSNAENALASACAPDLQSLEIVTSTDMQTVSQDTEVEAPVTTRTIEKTVTRTITCEPTASEDGNGEGDLQVLESVEETVEEDMDSRMETICKTVSVEVPVVSTETIQIETVNADEIQSALASYQEAGERLMACEAQLEAYSEQLDVLNAVAQASASDAGVQQQMAQQQLEQAKQLLALANGIIELDASLQQIYGGIAELAVGEDGRQGLLALSEGASQLKNGTSAAVSGAQELNSGANELSEGITALNEGAGRLKDGTGSLRDGATQLKSGTAQLKDGTGQLVEGTATLNEGTGSLKDGVNTLKDGVLTLNEGMGTLDEGALALVDGMFEFDEEGISRLTELFGDEVQDVIDRLKAVSDAGKEYNTFTRLPEGMDGSVKFIIKTEAIK